MTVQLIRRLVFAVGLATLAATTANATTALPAQRLTPPEGYASSFGRQNPAVLGDWIAVFGRLSDADGDGRVYIYHCQASTWSLFQEIVPPDSAGSRDSLAFTANALIVGSPGAWNTHLQSNAGAVSIYALQNGQWQLEETLYSYTGIMSGANGFGSSLAVDGSTLYVGFPGYINSKGLQVGDVEAYDLANLPSNYKGQILARAPVDQSSFGSSLAAANGTLAVGADNLGLTGVGASAGAIYTFNESFNGWSQSGMLTAPDPIAFAYFPDVLVVDGGRIVAGDAEFYSQMKGGPYGAAFSYRATSGQFSYESALPDADSYGGDMFGTSVTSVNGLSLVGSMGKGDAGQVFAFSHEAGGGSQAAGVFSVADLQSGDGFGASMATDGTTLVIGATESGRIPASPGAIYVARYPATDRVFGEGFEP
jgi:hypothetical protein